MDSNESKAILESIIQARIILLSKQLDEAKQRDDLPPYARQELRIKLLAAKKEKKELEKEQG